MEPATLIPSHSHSFKSESLTQMRRTHLHMHTYENAEQIVMISFKGFYTCNKLIT
jgi:hypothetical protein